MSHDPKTARIKPAVFEKAADHIEKHGWARGGYYPGWAAEDSMYQSYPEVGDRIRTEKLPACALGAIAAAHGSDSIPSLSAHTTFFGRMLGYPDDCEVPDWNDKPSQRKARVVRALRRAAEQARRKHPEPTETWGLM